MRFPRNIAALALAALLSGCSVPGSAPRTYQATVERIEDRPGDFYSPVSGHEPLICIYLKVAGDPGGGAVRVLLLGLYKPGIHGKEGDRVQFSFPGDLPGNRELDFENLSDYSVISPGG